MTALHHAASGGHVQIIRYLAPQMESLLHETNLYGHNTVHLAIRGAHADVIRLVIDKYKLDFTAPDVVSVY